MIPRLREALMTVACACVLSGCGAMPRVLDRSWEPAEPEDPPAVTPRGGAIYQAGHDVPLFENATARRVGDVLTIRLVENTNASKSSSTSTSKSTAVDLPGPTIAGRPVTLNGTPILDMSAENSTTFDGEGASRQSNRLVGDVTVTVQRRLRNGNLYVRGEKWITINTGREFVRVSGIVRPIDIEPDNSVPSLKVANAEIVYAGKGPVANSSAPGLLARFFNSPLMPF